MKNRLSAPRTALLAMLLPVAIASFQASASGWPVVDVVHIQTSLKTQFDALAQYAKQLQGMAKDAAHYKDVYNHYQQQLIKVKRMVSSLNFAGGQPLEKVDTYDGVEQRCHKKPSGLGLRNLLTGLAGANDDIVTQQRTICEAIQVAQNEKFNETVDFAMRVRKETQDDLAKLATQRDSGQTQGLVEGNTNAAITASAQFDAVYHDYTSRIQMYDAQISALEARQRTLAQLAMKGEDNPIGTLVKTGTLGAALKVGN